MTGSGKLNVAFKPSQVKQLSFTLALYNSPFTLKTTSFCFSPVQFTELLPPVTSNSCPLSYWGGHKLPMRTTALSSRLFSHCFLFSIFGTQWQTEMHRKRAARRQLRIHMVTLFCSYFIITLGMPAACDGLSGGVAWWREDACKTEHCWICFSS